MIPIEGFRKLLAMVADSVTPSYTGAAASISLFKNNITPDENTVFGDFVEADFSGYVSQDMDASFFATFAAPPGALSNGWNTITNFSHDGGGTANTIYGWYAHRDGKVIETQLFASPQSFSMVGDDISVAVRLGMFPTSGGGGGGIITSPDFLLSADDFTAADGTNINGRTETMGRTWTQLFGTHQINSNQLTDQDSGGSGSLSVVDLGTEDYCLDCDMTMVLGGAAMSPGSYAGFALRAVDASNYLYAVADFVNLQLAIGKVVAGVNTLLNYTTLTAATDTYRLTVRKKGNNIALGITGQSTGFTTINEVTTSQFSGNNHAGVLTLWDGDATYTQAILDNWIATQA